MSRFFSVSILTALLLTVIPAAAEVTIVVSIATQKMSVSIDGQPTYTWPVATGAHGHETPVGAFKPYWLHKNHFSSLYHNAPMPNSIFFNGNVAIHGSYDTIGRPASHGCVRLHPPNSAILYALVEKHGMKSTKIIVN